MNLSYHNKSQSLMSKIQRLHNTAHHQRNLQNIKKRTPSKQTNVKLEQNDKGQINYSNLHLSLQTGKEKNAGIFFTDNEFESGRNEQNFHNKQRMNKIESQNQIIVNKLVNVVSDLKLFNTGRVKTEGNQKFAIRRKNRVQSSSEVNRNRQNTRIRKENLLIKDRIITAMNSSQYSQFRSKNYEKEPNLNSTFFSQRNNRKTVVVQPQPKQQGEKQKEDFDQFNAYVQSNREQVFDCTSSNFMNSNHNRIKTQASLSKKFLRTVRTTNRQTQSRIEDQIDYVLLGKYKISGTSANANPSFSTTKQQQKIFKTSQQIERMKRAAMLHYRKIQKLRNTQSRVWQDCPKVNQNRTAKTEYFQKLSPEFETPFGLVLL